MAEPTGRASVSARTGFSPATRADQPAMLLVICAMGIVAIALMRCMIVFLPQLWFDVDPVSDTTPWSALGPAGSLWLDVALLLLSAATLWLCAGSEGAGIDWMLGLGALLPGAVVLWHGWHDAGDLWRGSTWLAAIIAAVALAHACRHRSIRVLVAAALLAVIGPLLVRAAAQVSFEHDATVRQYMLQRDTFLAQRGWTPDSPAAQMYERRLLQRQATGWFATSNIFASVMIAGIIAWVCLGWLAIRSRMESGWFGAALLLVLAMVASLAFTGSKGAILALLLTGGAMAAARWLATRSPQLGRLQPWIAVGVIGCALAGVVIRGVALPEQFAGDKSLLFRWHYLQSACGIIADHPLVGVGPDHFQNAYTVHRPPRNPEEVQSAHNIELDWLATLGIPAGAAWCACVLVLLFRSFPRDRDDPDQRNREHDAVVVVPQPIVVASITAVAAIVPALYAEWPAINDANGLLLRMIGVGLFIAGMSIAARILERCSEVVVCHVLGAAAVALLVHGQIEMTFQQPGSVVWAMCMLGVAGSSSDTRTGGRARSWSLVVPLGTLAIGLWLVMHGSLPASARQRVAADQAIALQAITERPQAASQLRIAAADALLAAYQRYRPDDRSLLLAAAHQRALAAREHSGAERLGHLRDADAAIGIGRTRHGHDQDLLRVHAALAAQIAKLSGESAAWDQAIKAHELLTQLDPKGLGAWQSLGDLLWDAGRHDQAAAAYRKTLECDAAFALDPLKQLTEAERTAIRQRIAQSD